MIGLIWLLGAGPLARPAVESRREGERLLAAGAFGAALEQFQTAALFVSGGGEVALGQAQAYLGRREAGPALDAALVAFGRLRDGRRAEAAAHAGQASALMGLSRQARAWWLRALALDDGTREAYLGLAALAEEEDQPAEAAVWLGEWLRREPADAEPAYRLGLALAADASGEARAAWGIAAGSRVAPWAGRADRLLAASTAGEDAYGAARLGVALLGEGEARPALRQFEKAVSLQPAYAEAQAYRGHALARLGRPALEAFEPALALDEDLVLAHYLLGRYYLQSGAGATARAEFERALALDADNPALGVDIALTYALDGEYALAETWLDAAVARAPAAEAIQLARARFYIERAYRLLDRGLPAADVLAARWPLNGEAQILRGRALYGLGRPAEALIALERGLALRPQDASGFLTLGLTLEALGRAAAARAAWDRAVDLEPTGPVGRQARALLAR
jgi:tetratricopeptide (TPR) repeat protein